jgi:tetratricopeptide (TPR) repeat protein
MFCSLYRAGTRYGLIFLIATASMVFNPAVCTAREPVELDRPEPGSDEDSLFDLQEPFPVYDPKQVGLIRARILSRRGMVQESLSIYRDLRRRYPQDEEIWGNYIETLVNEVLYQKALEEADGLLKKNPSNLRALRIQARMYAEPGRFSWTYPLFDKILRDRPRDAGAWFDYAFARQDAGDWAAALNYFQRVLELDPENGEALRQVQTILREHRPRLDMAYQAYRQEADDATRDQYTVRYRRPINPKWTLVLRCDRIHVERPEQVGAPALEETINDVTAKVDYRFHDDWLVRVGGGLFNGPVDGPSGLLGAAYKIGSRARIQGDYFLNRPWYDPVEAVAFEGRFDQGRIALDWNIDEKWGLFAGVEQ